MSDTKTGWWLYQSMRRGPIIVPFSDSLSVGYKGSEIVEYTSDPEVAARFVNTGNCPLEALLRPDHEAAP